jgi:hypothetical protein
MSSSKASAAPSATSTSTTTASLTGGGLSAGAKGGIIAGAIVAGLAVIGTVFVIRRERREKTRRDVIVDGEPNPVETRELHHDDRYGRRELEGEPNQVAELRGHPRSAVLGSL